MGDAYKHDAEGVLVIVESLSELKNEYNDKITLLNNLVNEINESQLWVDVEIKSSFIDTCNSHILIYNNLLDSLDIYINYLKKKSDMASSFEGSYVGGTSL